MLKKFSTLTLAVLIINLFLGATVFGAAAIEEKEAKAAAKVKPEITKLGTGRDARIEVKLKDGTKLKGYVTEVKDASFVVMNENTAAPIEVSYPAAKQIKGNNLNTGVKIAIIVGVTIVLLSILGYLLRDA